MHLIIKKLKSLSNCCSLVLSLKPSKKRRAKSFPYVFYSCKDERNYWYYPCDLWALESFQQCNKWNVCKLLFDDERNTLRLVWNTASTSTMDKHWFYYCWQNSPHSKLILNGFTTILQVFFYDGTWRMNCGKINVPWTLYDWKHCFMHWWQFLAISIEVVVAFASANFHDGSHLIYACIKESFDPNVIIQ